MSRISDPVLLSISDGFSTAGLPKATARGLYKALRLLLAAVTIDDVSAVSPFYQAPDGRIVILTRGKWGISFQLIPGLGPNDLQTGETEIMARKAQPLFTPSTPGEVLKENILIRLGITQETLAKAMSVSRLTVNQIINGKRAVTPEMALRLSRVLTTTPEFWLNLQRDFDLSLERPRLDAELKKLPILRRSDVAAA
jgi:addiction module HigA family antidote